MIGGLDKVEIMLDNEHGITRIHKTLKHIYQLCDIGGVQSGRRLVEQIEGPAGRALCKLGGKLYALSLAAGERCGGLSELDISESDLAHCTQLARD